MESTIDTKDISNGRTRRGLEILQAALIIGISGDSLLRAAPWGLNFFLWVTLLSVGLWVVVTRRREEKAVSTIALHSALIFFAAMFVWRDSIQLLVADVMAILVVFAVLTLPAMKLSFERSGVAHYMLGWVYSSFNAAIAPFFILAEDIKWNSVPKGKSVRIAAAAGKGLAVALPLVLIFGALFMAADAAYEKLIRETIQIDLEQLMSHLLLITFLSWGTAGYFRGADIFTFRSFAGEKMDGLSIFAKDGETKAGEQAAAAESGPAADTESAAAGTAAAKNQNALGNFFSLGTIELSVILGLTNLVFLSFVIVQLPYLFGGMELVRNTEDLKLADYARRGFGELVFVAALVLPMLLLTHWLIKKNDKTSLALYRVLAVAQVLLLFVVMISAGQRMLLYTGTSGYGLTTMRFYPMVFMVWLSFVFVWFGATVLRNRRDQFAWGTLWSALGFLAVLHAFNPDDFIARTNFALLHSGRNFDAHYISELSDDAVPAVADELPRLNDQQKCVLVSDLFRQYKQETAYEWDLRSWNWSRENARRQTEQIIEGFDPANCSPGDLRRVVIHDDDF
jgi:hypothetical protein